MLCFKQFYKANLQFIFKTTKKNYSFIFLIDMSYLYIRLKNVEN